MKIVRILALVAGGLVVGAMFGIWRGYNPSDLSASASVEQHQQAVRGLNVLLPGLGAVTIVFTIAVAVQVRHRRLAVLTFALAALLFGISGIVTRTRNQPINRIVMRWDARTPPPEWIAMRQEWWRWHRVRTFAGMAGFFLLAVGAVCWPAPDRKEPNPPANAR